MVARAPDGSHLIGSAMALQQAGANLCENLGLTAEQAQRLTSVNPANVLNL
jgi:N-acetylglucosamine-6-phosphate deacetylase